MPRINKKKEAQINKTKTSKEEISTGDLFDNSKIKENVPLIITNFDKNADEKKINKFDDKKNDLEKSEDSIEDSIFPEKIKSVLKNVNKPFSLEFPVFIQIHQGNLLQYFASTLIYPNKYSNQNAFPDAQSLNTEGLLLSNGYINDSSDHILIQINAESLNLSDLTINYDFALYNGCLPITSIVKIIVSKADTKKKLIEDSIIREGGFVPEKLITVGLPKNISAIKYQDVTIKKYELSELINKYDKILGLIAGTNNFNLLTFNQTGLYKSISDHSLYAIQAINPDFGKEIINNASISEYYKWMFLKSCPEDRLLLKWIFERVYNNENFTDKDTLEFERLYFRTNVLQDEEKDVKNIFTLLKNSVSRKKALAQILNLQSKHALAIYVFAYLRIYGTRQNPELARLDLSYIQYTKYTEYAFATLNFFFGYKQLRNSEDRSGLDKVQILREHKYVLKPVIKFEMISLFDYILIDNVYNYVFTSTSLKFNHYDRYLDISKSSPKIKADNTDKIAKMIFGKEYFNIKKINPFDELMPILESLPNDIPIFSEFGLCCYRLNLKLNKFSFSDVFSNPSSLVKMFSYSKVELINSIRENKIEFEEVKLRIELSKKHREL